MELVERAIRFAMDKHAGSVRKFDGSPYIIHPIMVAVYFGYFKKSTNRDLLFACAILHDVVEDTDTTIDEIAKNFGEQIASIVDELTFDEAKLKQFGKEACLKEKAETMSSYAFGIKLADRLHNVSDLDKAPADFRRKTIEQTIVFIGHAEKVRKLTGTHIALIDAIKLKLNTYENIC